MRACACVCVLALIDCSIVKVAARDVAAAEAGIRTIRGHQLPLTCVALADDEKTAYTGSKDGTIIQCTPPHHTPLNHT